MEQVQYVGLVLCNGKRSPSPAKYEALRELKQEQIVICLCLGAYRKPIFLVLHLKNSFFPMFCIIIDLVGKYRTQATAGRQRS